MDIALLSAGPLYWVRILRYVILKITPYIPKLPICNVVFCIMFSVYIENLLQPVFYPLLTCLRTFSV